MKISDLLRTIADKLDGDEQSVNDDTEKELEQQDEDASMVPPLQQELELKKREHGIDNIYDSSTNLQESINELSIIKRNAGIL